MMIGQLRAEIYEKQVSGWNVQILIRNHSPTTNSDKHLPSQKSLRFWWLVRLRSVRTRNVLFVEFPGIEFSFPFFLSALPQAHSPTTHHQIRYQWLEPRSVYSISYYYLAFVSHFRFRRRRHSLRSKPLANRLEVGFLSCHFRLILPISFSSFSLFR